MKTYLISGTFRMGEIKAQPFRKEIKAESKEAALDKVYCLLGSQHRCKRRWIKILEIKEV